MNKMSIKSFFLDILAVFFCLNSFFIFFGFSNIVEAAAGVPSVIGYQGRLADASGDLLGGSSGTTYYFKFSIWDVATGGTSGVNRLWPSSDPSSVSSTVRQGVFNVDIDVSDYNFNTSSGIYLQVEVSLNGTTGFETLSPRQRISSTAFARISGAVSGVGQSSFGTTTPASNAVVTVAATSTSSIPVLIRAFAGQVASLLRIEDSSLNHLFSINSLGGIFASSTLNVSGATNLYSNLKVSDADSVPQLRLGQTGYAYGEFYVDSTGDVLFSSNSGEGGNLRMQDENLWVCSGGGCDVDIPTDQGNIIVETSVIFDNKFKLKQVDASTTIMYDTTNSVILEFDEGQ